MELIKAEELKLSPILRNIGSDIVIKMFMSVFKINRINQIYAENHNKPLQEFLDNILNEIGVNYNISDIDFEKIPRTGPFIIVANHPYGGLDGIILMHALLKIRPDLKVMTNYLLQRIEPIKEHIIATNPFEVLTATKDNIRGLKACIEHLEKRQCLAIFPAGEVSTYQQGYNVIVDRKWQKNTIKLIAITKVPVVPIHFSGTNSTLFHWLGFIHPVLRTAKIPSELLNKNKKNINVRIGSPIPASELELFDLSKLGRYLRAKTYALGSTTNVNLFFPFRGNKKEEVIPKILTNLLLGDIKNLPKKYELFRHKKFVVFAAHQLLFPK
ncbi:MAG: hypothetical protein HC905_20830 [Bacteroidales bacterium]|nr:hypothetical protein [Bacteroidales bacterium]